MVYQCRQPTVELKSKAFLAVDSRACTTGYMQYSRIYPGREPFARIEGEYTRAASQSHTSRENIPGMRANRAHRGRIYPGREPIARIEGEYTRDASQSHASRENIPGTRANRAH
eukprot:1152149-Prorocentrum_minimum.AAC.2